MNRVFLTICVLCAGMPATIMAVEVPGDAERYLRVLLHRPHQAVLFERFQNAWLDERSADELLEFLVARAAAEGGVHHVLLARFHLRRGRDEVALPALDAAIQAMPGDAVLRIERARLHTRVLDFDAAVEDLEKARMSGDVEHALEAAKLLGQSQMRSGNAEMAAAVWDETIDAHPENQDLLEDLVELAAAEGDAGRALGYIERLLAMTDDPTKQAARTLRRASLLGLAGRFDEALELCGAVLDAAGHGSWVERDVLAHMEGLFRRANREVDFAPHLRALAEAHPGRWMIQRRLAHLEAGAGEIDAAVRRMREVLRRAPGGRELREEFIRILANGGRLDEAVEELETLIGETPQDTGLWLHMADLRQRAEQPERVPEALEKVLDIHGGSEPEALRIANLMLRYEHEDPGVELLRERMNMPDATTAPAQMLADYFARTKRRKLALDLLADLAAHGDLDTLLRATSSATALLAQDMSYEWLAARRDEFNTEWRFLLAWLHAAQAAEQPREATAEAMRLARMATTADEMAEAIWLAALVIDQALEIEKHRLTLQALESPLPGERALHAALLERKHDFDRANELLEGEATPALVWFHTAMLMRRGHLQQAIERLHTLADTTEGRRAAYVKMLADLHLRAGNVDAALEYSGEWKLRAPDDRSAWIFHANVLCQLGHNDEALWQLRQAVARFDGAPELAVRMALLFSERGDFEPAVAIHRRIKNTLEAPGQAQGWGTYFRDLDRWIRRVSDRLASLEAILAESPDDVETALVLAFSTGLSEPRVVQVLDHAAAHGDAFALTASGMLRAMGSSSDVASMRLAIERLAVWLEAHAPGDLDAVNLTWVNHHARRHIDELLLAGIPEETTDELAMWRARTAERLARAMLRHDATAEAGFRMLRTWHPLDIAHGGLDAPARRAITARRMSRSAPDSMRHGLFAVHPDAGGTATILDELDAHGSWAWLAHRINAVGAATASAMAALLRDFAAITDAEMDHLAAEIDRVMLGPSRDWETLRRDLRTLPHVIGIDHKLRQLLTSPREIMKVARLAHLSDIPLHWAIPIARAFRLAFVDGAPAMERFLEESGLLRDATHWQPPVGIVVSSTSGPAPQLRLERTVLFEHIFSRPLSRDPAAIQGLRARLEAREEGKFGAMMVLASLSSGDERRTITARAFNHSAAELAALPPQNWERVAFAAGWLSPQAIEALPENLAARLDAAR